MPGMMDRYARAMGSSNLRSQEITTNSDADVIGAAGMAGVRQPLAMALARLMSGDNRASIDVTAQLSTLAWGKAQAMRVKLKRAQADDMAAAVLGWMRGGVCKPCGGHGFELQSDAVLGESRAVLSDRHCKHCKGTGKVPFEREFHKDLVELARWLLVKVEEESSKAGPAVMAKLAQRMGL